MKHVRILSSKARRLLVSAVLLSAVGMPMTAVQSIRAQEPVLSKFEAKVVSVTDGDTLTVLHNGEKEKVILYGVDCPELAQEFGPEAKQFTDEKCFRQVVKLQDHGKDAHGRTIAEIQLADGSDLGQTLVTKGLAWWSDKYAPRDDKLRSLFNYAKGEHIGLWQSPNPIPPWIFRNGERATQATIVPKK